MMANSGVIGGPVKPPTNLGSNDISLDTVGPQAQQQQQPLMLYYNHQPVPMGSLQFLLTTNSNLCLPFNNNQVMTMMNSALSGSSPRDNDFAYPVSLLRNTNELSNLNHIAELSNEYAPSGRSASNPKNGMFLQTNQVNSAAVESARCASLSQSSIDLTTLSRDNSRNTWLDVNGDIGIGHDHYVAGHDVSEERDWICPSSATSSISINDVALNAVAAEVKPCGELNSDVAQSNIDLDAFIERYFPRGC